jgi:hypothetical protein
MMIQRSQSGLKVLAGGHYKLEALHDQVIGFLDTGEKQGIMQLLKKNNELCKKLIFPYLKFEENRAEVMTALSGVLEAHARECYTIGYLDCILNKKKETKNP